MKINGIPVEELNDRLDEPGRGMKERIKLFTELHESIKILGEIVKAQGDTVTALQKEVEELKHPKDRPVCAPEDCLTVGWCGAHDMVHPFPKTESQFEKHVCIYVKCPHKKPESQSEWCECEWKNSCKAGGFCNDCKLPIKPLPSSEVRKELDKLLVEYTVGYAPSLPDKILKLIVRGV